MIVIEGSFAVDILMCKLEAENQRTGGGGTDDTDGQMDGTGLGWPFENPSDTFPLTNYMF